MLAWFSTPMIECSIVFPPKIYISDFYGCLKLKLYIIILIAFGCLKRFCVCDVCVCSIPYWIEVLVFNLLPQPS